MIRCAAVHGDHECRHERCHQKDQDFSDSKVGVKQWVA